MRVTTGLAMMALSFGSAAAAQNAAPAPAPPAATPPAPQVYRLTPDEIAKVQAESLYARSDNGGWDTGALHDRKIHGEIAAGIGTGGYRGIAGDIGVPLGNSANAVIGFESSQSNAWPYGRRGRTGAYFGGNFGPGW